MQVRNNVQPKRATIAVGIRNAQAQLHRRQRVIIRAAIPTRQPVLRRNVAVPYENRRQARNRIITVRHAPLTALLAGEPVGEVVVTDARRAEGVNVHGETVATKVRRAQCCDGSTERVARSNELVAWVLVASGLHGACDGVLDLLPALGEAGVDFTFVDKVAALPGEEDVGDEVADVVAAADGEDNFLAGLVYGYVGADSGPLSTGRYV